MESIQNVLFDEYRSKIMTFLQSCLDDENNNFEQKWNSMENDEIGDRNLIVDYCLRELLREKQDQKCENHVIKQILDLSISAAVKEICSTSVPVLLLSDIFDSSPINICESLFSLVEERVDVWKKDNFFSGCKNHLLRCCNDLLRRLSRSQNTVFCGRILMFLATLFPLSERSGLNIASEFNIDNKTQFSLTDNDDLSDASHDLDDGKTNDKDSQNLNIVDYNLYRKFWELQEYFREPNQLFNKIPWKKFISYSGEVLSAFASFNIDHVKSSNWKTEELESPDAALYFAKYLTSPKLLDLEINDTNFRRYILLQFLITFQYLTSNVKFKSEKKLNLQDDQSSWITLAEDKIYKLLEDTPPDGCNFAKCIKRIFEREEYWNNWKNEGCPKFDPPVDKKPETDTKKQIRKKRPAIGNVIREATVKKRVLMGNAELTRLWNLCPNNEEACRTNKRNFMPSIETYFDDAIDQCKPEHQIEDQYKLIYEPNFGWKSLRLLSRQSYHFFTHSNQPCKSLPLYLENMINKIAKELPQQANQDHEVSVKQEVHEMTGNTDEDDEFMKNEDPCKNNTDEEKDEKSAVVSIDQVTALAPKLGADWKKIAPKLGFQDDEILFIESEHASSVTEQARKMLILWTENDGEDATVDKFVDTVKALNLLHLDIDLFSSSDANNSNDSEH